MFHFLFKGIIRDRHRSLLPIIVVAIGVFVVIFLDGIIGGMMENMTTMTANFQTGHLRIMTRAYALDEEQKPNDLALLDVDDLLNELNGKFQEITWTPRIMFGGLLDIPDVNGETRAQGPVSAQAFDLVNIKSGESERLGLSKAIIEGRSVSKPGEILISIDFADKFGVKPGNIVTFFGTTMHGAMSFGNYTVAGIVRFGNSMLDRGAIIMDIEDAREILDMKNAAGEIVGFMPDEKFNMEYAEKIKEQFNSEYKTEDDEYAPVMSQLADDEMIRETMAYSEKMAIVMVVLLVAALSIVLWNAGVLGGIRRYNEFGVRLAIGEEKQHIYKTLLAESLIIGVVGSVIGTVLGILLCWVLSIYGMDFSSMLENISMMVDPVIHTRISPRMFFIGIIPGTLSMLAGTALAGRAVYKRNTASLFKELD